MPTARRAAASAAPPAYAAPDAIEYLRGADPVLRRLIDSLGPPEFARTADRPAPGEHYASLVRAIVGQQLSTHAARAIWSRLLARFDGDAPNPAQILASDPEELRAAVGLSRAKVSFLRSLAEHVENGELDLERLEELSDEQIIAELTAVRGLGTWSAHMFLMFQLERPDVLAVGDLGVRRAVEKAYGLDALPEPATVGAIAEPWRPQRTLACRYLWLSLRNQPV